jgi:hypothetical protein
MNTADWIESEFERLAQSSEGIPKIPTTNPPPNSSNASPPKKSNCSKMAKSENPNLCRKSRKTKSPLRYLKTGRG